MNRVLIIDDDKGFLKFIRGYIEEHFPALEIETCDTALQGLKAISSEPDLLLLDLEMPHMDGKKLLSYATELGLNKNRVIILSAHHADFLHEQFPMGSCLAVLNKHEARQKVVLDMIFNSLQGHDPDYEPDAGERLQEKHH